MEPQKEFIAEEDFEIDPTSEEYRLIVELTSLVQDAYAKGETKESRERCKELKELLKSRGMRVDFIEFAPGEPSFTINRLH